MRTRDAIEFLGVWERINNLNFKPIEFDGLRNKAGLYTGLFRCIPINLPR